MNSLRNLRDAVLGRQDRTVEVAEDGSVREAGQNENRTQNVDDESQRTEKVTKLAPRTFGHGHSHGRR